MRRWVIGGTGVVLVVATVMWGRDGVEAASWIAGVASLFVAVVTCWSRCLPRSPVRDGS